MSTRKLVRLKLVIVGCLFLMIFSVVPATAVETLSGIVKRGATASTLLNAYLPLKTIFSLEKQAQKVFPLTRIRQGRPYKIRFDEAGLIAFEYEINSSDCLLIQKAETGYTVSKAPIQYDLKSEVVTVDIQSSLAEAVQRAGERAALTWKMADIFAWDIDFIRDIRPGDRFEALVEKRYRDDKFCGYNDIKAVFFTNRNTTYRAFLYENESGRNRYYDEAGHSLEKAFLKAPLKYDRISSVFSTRRFHPILKKYRAHPGVDYAAPKNTPIKAVAEGVITSIYYSKTTGRQISLRHCGGYGTSYFHMNKYARNMKRGKKVAQGEVIGYVGKTGLATGYHLCFRMRKNGKPVDPLCQVPRAGKPVGQEDMSRFLSASAQYSQQIAAYNKLAQSQAQ